MSVATCSACKTEKRTEGGKIVEHSRTQRRSVRAISSGYPKGGGSQWTDEDYVSRCEGSLGTPLETLTKNRERARSKRRGFVLAVRDEASVVLDAILTNRTDLDEEFGKPRRRELLDLALVGYRLENPKQKVSHGILWGKGTTTAGDRCHALFCRFCGCSIAKVPLGAWSRYHETEREMLTGRHVMVCALQFLSGLRKIVEPGTKVDGYDGPLFDDALARQCGACGALPGIACVMIDSSGRRGYTTSLQEPHDARLYPMRAEPNGPLFDVTQACETPEAT